MKRRQTNTWRCFSLCVCSFFLSVALACTFCLHEYEYSENDALWKQSMKNIYADRNGVSKGQYRNLVFFWVCVWEDMVTATLFALFEYRQFLPIQALLLRVLCWETRVHFDDVLLGEDTGQENRVQSSGQRYSGQVTENVPCSRWNQRHS